MPIRANLTGNARFSVPGGLPITLSPAWETLVEGVVPKGTATVAAEVAAESGTADVHLAIYNTPTSSGAADGALVLQEDLIGLTSEAQTLTLTVPAGDDTAEKVYIVRLWVDELNGLEDDTADHSPPNPDRFGVGATVYSTTPEDYNPRRPTGVIVSAFGVT